MMFYENVCFIVRGGGGPSLFGRGAYRLSLLILVWRRLVCFREGLVFYFLILGTSKLWHALGPWGMSELLSGSCPDEVA